MPDSDLDRAVAARAVRQHGLFTDRQAAAAGASPAATRHRLQRGRWTTVAPGVRRLAGVPVTWRSHVLAAILAAGPGAAASHRTSGILWELDGCRPGKPEISVPRGRRARVLGARVHESTDLHLADVRIIDGIPTTGVARTVLDLGAVVSPAAVHVALDSALRRGRTNWDEVLDTLVAHARRGRRGVGPLRAILAAHFGEVETDSDAERLLAALLTEAGLPSPVLQHEVELDGRRFSLDLAYPADRVGIEYDGRGHLEIERWEADHPRQNAIVLDEWRLLRYTRRNLVQDPQRIVREVRRALRAARSGPPSDP